MVKMLSGVLQSQACWHHKEFIQASGSSRFIDKVVFRAPRSKVSLCKTSQILFSTVQKYVWMGDIYNTVKNKNISLKMFGI